MCCLLQMEDCLMTKFTLPGLWFAIVVAMAAAPARAAETKVINITPAGTDAQFIEDGKTKQLNVRIKIGDTVKWVNRGDRTHTATSDVRTAAGKRIFDLTIAQNGDASFLFDQAAYDAAVKATG